MEKNQYAIGMEVIVDKLSELHSEFNGKRAIIVRAYGIQSGFGLDGIRRNTMGIQVYFEGGKLVNVSPHNITLALPLNRADLDIPVSWAGFVILTGADPRNEPGAQQ